MKCFVSKNIVCGGGDARGVEQHVCKVILVISFSISQAEQYKHGSKMGKNIQKNNFFEKGVQFYHYPHGE